ncbi:MAG: nucleoside triphosphate pyrophosphohydrolase [FCB group bacterium]|jgi:XTP/dITP diphosphohydrolase
MSNGNIEAPKAKDQESLLEQFQVFVDIVKILRKECPWDKEQTNESISHLLIEEAYETIDAIEKNNSEDFAEELGDLFLHIVMHAVIAEERGAFNLVDVLKKIQHKLIYRHPHVFSNVEVDGEKDVLRNWENLKLKEGKTSILEGVPDSMPALLRAQRMQFKASKVGFDWNNKIDVWAKVDEEIEELKREMLKSPKAKTENPLTPFEKGGKTEEIGDLLFALVNAIRFEDIVAEEALQKTNNKFRKRFQYIEQKAAEQKRMLSDMTLEEMDVFWEEAKSKEKE